MCVHKQLVTDIPGYKWISQWTFEKAGTLAQKYWRQSCVLPPEVDMTAISSLFVILLHNCTTVEIVYMIRNVLSFIV